AAIAADSLERTDVLVAVLLQVLGEVEHRAGEQLLLVEKQRDQNSSQATVSIDEGVNDFKLSMDDAELDERIRRIGVVVLLPIVEVLEESLRRGGNEFGRFDRRSPWADPVLDPAKLAAALVPAADAVEQNRVKFFEEVQVERLLPERGLG